MKTRIIEVIELTHDHGGGWRGDYTPKVEYSHKDGKPLDFANQHELEVQINDLQRQNDQYAKLLLAQNDEIQLLKQRVIA